MHDSAGILLTLFIIFVAAQIGGEIAQRLRLPAVVGEIAAGCVVGPSALGWVTVPDIATGTPLEFAATLGRTGTRPTRVTAAPMTVASLTRT